MKPPKPRRPARRLAAIAFGTVLVPTCVGVVGAAIWTGFALSSWLYVIAIAMVTVGVLTLPLLKDQMDPEAAR